MDVGITYETYVRIKYNSFRSVQKSINKPSIVVVPFPSLNYLSFTKLILSKRVVKTFSSFRSITFSVELYYNEASVTFEFIC